LELLSTGRVSVIPWLLLFSCAILVFKFRWLGLSVERLPVLNNRRALHWQLAAGKEEFGAFA
jgi:hypothetical protein